MFEFLKRFKTRDRVAARRSLLKDGQVGNTDRDSDPIDAVLSTIVMQEILSMDLSSQVEPDADSSSIDSGSGDGSGDTGPEFDAGGGDSGGGGASDDW